MGLLDGVLGGSRQSGSGMSPLTMLLLGVLAYRTYQGKGRLADMLGRGGPAPAPAGTTPPGTPVNAPTGGLGDLLGGNLGGLLAGGAAGGLLGGGLRDLLDRFQQNGHGDIARSWIGTGPNQAISPGQIEQALGPETVSSLAQQAGISNIDLVSGLSRDLPDAVDQLTPDGRLPNA